MRLLGLGFDSDLTRWRAAGLDSLACFVHVQLVDVREDEELVLAQVAHAVIHLPLSRSQEWLGGIDTLLDAQRPVAVLCHAGVRSWHFGCWLLQERGFREVWNLVGGIDAWSVEVDPAVTRY